MRDPHRASNNDHSNSKTAIDHLTVANGFLRSCRLTLVLSVRPTSLRIQEARERLRSMGLGELEVRSTLVPKRVEEICESGNESWSLLLGEMS